MVPIHDTDLAEKRWSDSEWRQFELWDKIEVRLRRRRRRWSILAGALFLLLASVPTVVQRWPKWASLHAARRIAEEINAAPNPPLLHARAFRLVFERDEGMAFSVYEAPSCESPSDAWRLVRQGRLLTSGLGRLVSKRLRVLDNGSGVDLGIPGLTRDYCASGGAPFGEGVVAPERSEHSVRGIAVIQDRDQSEKNISRISVVSLTGPQDEVDFE